MFNVTPQSMSTVIKSMAFVMRLFNSSDRQKQYLVSLALRLPIRRCGNWSLRYLRTSRDQCGGAPFCCKIKSSPSARSYGNSQSLIVCRHGVLVTVFSLKKNDPYTFSLKTVQKKLSLGESFSCSRQLPVDSLIPKFTNYDNLPFHSN